jgi:hypothetical protein
MDKYDYAYDADNEYDNDNDIDDDEDKYPQISRQIFIDIGNYIVQLWNETDDLHECKSENANVSPTHIDNVGACRQPIRSVSSELFSLCSNETDETVFKYYISDDEINVDLT